MSDIAKPDAPVEAVPGARRVSVPHDDGIVLLIPKEDVADPEVSIVIPALDEELMIAGFLAWCREGIARAGVAAEDKKAFNET